MQTPDADMNRLINIWGKRQSWVTYNCNRNAGYYHGGLLFGVGMRDQCQDMMGPILSNPADVKNRLREVVTHQFQDGSTLHNYFKLTGVGEKTGHSDTPLWIPLAVVNYLKETADWEFLAESAVFQDGNQATIIDHVIKAVEYVLSQLTENHLPKFGPGDWNDTLDYVGREGIGESVWVAHFLCYILKETALLMEKYSEVINNSEFADKLLISEKNTALFLMPLMNAAGMENGTLEEPEMTAELSVLQKSRRHYFYERSELGGYFRSGK